MALSTPQKKRRPPIIRVFRLAGWLLAGLILVFIIGPLALWAITAPEYDGYNYYTFRQVENNANYIEAGSLFPTDINVYTVDGTPVPIRTLWEDKPLVLETGSNSCPIYWSSEVSMSSLANSYSDRANVVVLYTREAHPGLLAQSHRNIDDKLSEAKKLAAGVQQQQVLVDDVSGTLHNQLGGGSNSVYIIGTDGIVAHYAYWNNPEVTMEKLDELLQAGGKGHAVEATSIPCRDLSKTREGFTPQVITQMMFGITQVGGPDALVDFMAYMITAEGGPDPLCEVE